MYSKGIYGKYKSLKKTSNLFLKLVFSNISYFSFLSVYLLWDSYFCPPPPLKNHIFTQNLRLKNRIILKVTEAHANFEESLLWRWGGGGGGAEPSYRENVLDCRSIMEHFGTLNRSTSRSPLRFLLRFLLNFGFLVFIIVFFFFPLPLFSFTWERY